MVKFFNIEEFLYFCTIPGTPHKLQAHLLNEEFIFYGSLKSLLKRNRNFILCHKAFVVNKLNVKSINKRNRIITLINEEKYRFQEKGLSDF